MNHFHTLFDYISEKQLQAITKAGIGKVSGGLTPDILSPQQKRRSRLHWGEMSHTGEKQYYGRLHESEQWWSHAIPLFVTPITRPM